MVRKKRKGMKFRTFLLHSEHGERQEDDTQVLENRRDRERWKDEWNKSLLTAVVYPNIVFGIKDGEDPREEVFEWG